MKDITEQAGLETEVLVTGVFDDIPARTEIGRSEWGVDDGGAVFDKVVKGMKDWDELQGKARQRARSRFVGEWARLAGSDGLVREEGRLFVGIGRKL